jgi:hypothetical protein
MNEKLRQMLAMFPGMFANMRDENIARMGFALEDVKAVRAQVAEETKKHHDGLVKAGLALPHVTAESSYAALNWNIVSTNGISAYVQQRLAPIVNVFSTDISGDAVPADNPAAMPSVTVPVFDIDEDDAVVNPTNLDDLDSGNFYGVNIKLDVIGAGIEVPISAIREGYKAQEMVKGVVETTLRKAMSYVLGKLVATGVTDTAGKTIAVPEVVEVPNPDTGWTPGYVNRKLTGLLESENRSLLVSAPYYAALRPDDKLSLDFRGLALDGVYEVRQVKGLGADVVGVLAAKNSLAVAMRAPTLYGPAYETVMQFVDGNTGLPLTMVQYYKPGEMTMHIKVLTAIGAKRVVPASARILKNTTVEDELTA